MTKSERIPIRVTSELKESLERLADDHQRTLSDYVRLVLAQHIKSVECFDELASNEATINVSGLKHVSKNEIVIKVVE